MVNSGTGHDRCPSLASRAHQAPGSHLCGGDLEITKTVFGFKRGVQIFWPVGSLCEDATVARAGTP